jgi:Holliday junction resolvase RusA-like endonuclease
MLRFRSRKDAEEAGVLRQRPNPRELASHTGRLHEPDPVRKPRRGAKAESGPADPAAPRVPRRKPGNRLSDQQQREAVGGEVPEPGAAFELDLAPAPIQPVEIGLGLGDSAGPSTRRYLLTAVPLPLGPSINVYWSERIVWSAEKKRHFPIRYVTHEGKAYQKYIRELMLERQAWYRSENPLYLRLLCCFPDERGRDIDNVVKVLQDSLMNGHVFKSDTQVKQLEVREGPRLKPGVVFVSLSEILPDRNANLAWIRSTGG